MGTDRKFGFPVRNGHYPTVKSANQRGAADLAQRAWPRIALPTRV
jgi:hypothetical protein